jgi:hypothetical protein
MLSELCTFSNFENETERTAFSSDFLAGWKIDFPLPFQSERKQAISDQVQTNRRHVPRNHVPCVLLLRTIELPQLFYYFRRSNTVFRDWTMLCIIYHYHYHYHPGTSTETADFSWLQNSWLQNSWKCTFQLIVKWQPKAAFRHSYLCARNGPFSENYMHWSCQMIQLQFQSNRKYYPLRCVWHRIHQNRLRLSECRFGCLVQCYDTR